MKIGIVSLGCSKNLVDTEYAMRFLTRQGHTFVRDPAKADAIIVNTCGFINDAKEESINTILEMAEYKSKKCKKLIVMGCLATRYHDELCHEIPEVDRYITINEYDHLDSIFRETLKEEGNVDCDLVLATKPWTAYLKIADGCNNMCAFCAIPKIRGRYKSRTMEDIVENARLLASKGVKELNLIAQDTTKYGIDIYGKPCLDKLLVKLNELDFHWIRILYMYPDELSDELINVISRLDKVVPYFDIPSQHASDRILKLMRRQTNVSRLRAIIKKIRESCNDPVLRTTVIVGFPTEKREDFDELYEFVREACWDRLGAFTYSLEEDTEAYDIHPRIAQRVSKARYDKLMSLQQKISEANNERYLNSVQEVLVEETDAFGRRYRGRSYHFAPDDIDGYISFTSKNPLELGTFVKVRITSVTNYNWSGEVIDN